MASVPPELARFPLQTFSPRQAEDLFAHPRQELKRLADAGLLHRLAHGYYVVVPTAMIGLGWRPSVEAAAAGIAVTRFGEGNPVLMGPSAARLLGALPRAIAGAVVASPVQHRHISFADRPGGVRFVKRDTKRLDAVSVPVETGRALITSIEQTVLDLARWPTAGGLSAQECTDVVTILLRSADPAVLLTLAQAQRQLATLKRLDKSKESA